MYAVEVNESSKVRVLYMGAAELLSGYPGGPFYHLLNDPFFDVTPVRCFFLGSKGYSDEIIKKAMRANMPRNYKKMIDKYAVVTLFYASRGYFDAKYSRWISDGVKKEGMGLVFSGHGAPWAYDWTTTEVGDLLPVEMIDSEYTRIPSRIRIKKEDHPLISSLPWSDIGVYGVMAGQGNHKRREGAEVMAELVSPFGKTRPFLAWWEVGRGRSIAMMTRFSTSENPFLDWDYLSDLTSNLHLYAVGREIPSDIEIVHKIRMSIGEYRLRVGILVSFVEFIEKLGGNPSRIERVKDRARSRMSKVYGLYLSYEFEICLELVQEAIVDLKEAEDLAMKIKDQTFIWIYLIEWGTLTSTGLITGIVTWSLLVRRRLYREVRTTRLDKVRENYDY